MGGCYVGIYESGRTLILGWGITGGPRRGIRRGSGGERGPSCAIAAGERAVLVDISAGGRGAGFVFGAFRVCLATRERVLIRSAGSGACQGRVLGDGTAAGTTAGGNGDGLGL